jgi:hypothetical protein
MKGKYWWIKQRDTSPGTHYVLYGKITVKEARGMEGPPYKCRCYKCIGVYNHMHKFETEAAYFKKIDWLIENGFSFKARP